MARLAAQTVVVPAAETDVAAVRGEVGGGVQRMANLVGSLPWAAYMGRNWTPAQITARVAAMARGTTPRWSTATAWPTCAASRRAV